MYKKTNNFFVFFLMILIFPLTISTVKCQWAYSDGPTTGNSLNFDVSLGKFNLIPYPNEYPSTPEGQDNNNIFDKITGSDPLPDEGKNGWPLPETNDNISLTDPNSPINKALATKSIFSPDGIVSEQKPYITSMDYFNNNDVKGFDSGDVTAKEYFYGKDADPNIKFVIVRATFDSLTEQIYYIYTTTEDLSNLKSGDRFQYVYKTTMVWTRNSLGGDITGGKYSISTTGNVRGSCQVTKKTTITNQKGKNVTSKEKFFDYGTFAPIN